ncbi:MAG: ABC transporter permease [Oscillospiraceae bacterium]
MWKYLCKKTIQFVLVLIAISFFSFAIIYIAPGDVSQMYMRPEMTAEQMESLKASLGVDKSLWEQYIAWLGLLLQGDFGVSLVYKSAVAPQLLSRLPATILLMGSSMLLSIVIAIPLGMWSGYRKDGWPDRLISGFSHIGMSIPPFWFGTLLIILLSSTLRLLPSSGMQTPGAKSALDTFRHLIMPCLTLSISHVAVYIRYVRSSTIGELEEEYVLTAEAKGTRSGPILRRHVMKNTLLPIITLLGMNLSSLVSGSFIVESVFGWPGVGTLAMTAINSRDYPIIMAYVMLSGTLLVLGNFLADVLYALVDPRIRRGEASRAVH